MILPKDVDRSWAKPVWKYMRRLGRCINLAMLEGGFNDRFADTVIHGQSFYTPEQQAIDNARVIELMRGLKPPAGKE